MNSRLVVCESHVVSALWNFLCCLV